MELHSRKQKKRTEEKGGSSEDIEEDGVEECTAYEPGLMQRLFGYVVLALGSLFLTIELGLYVLVRHAIYLIENFRFSKIRRRIGDVQTYEEWVALAQELDATLKKNDWKKVGTCKCTHPHAHIHNNFYDTKLITGLTKSLTRLQHSGDTHAFMGALHAACAHNVGGIENSELYSHTFHGTKVFVQDFYDALEGSLESLKGADLGDEDREIVKRTLENANRNWGRTALFLSGGGAMAYPDLGVVRGLLERGVLPRIVCGSSCGALVAALTCLRSDEEVLEVLRDPKLISERFVFNDEPWDTIVARFVKETRLVDDKRWAEKLQWVTFGNTTFLEAYKKTGKILNISVTDVETSSSVLLNYVTSPNVCVYSAVLASAAMPLGSNPIQLMWKRPGTDIVEPYPYSGSSNYRDGSLYADTPLDALCKLFNVRFSIVVQCNPHAVPFYFKSHGTPGRPVLEYGDAKWRGGVLLALLEELLRREMLGLVRLAHNFEVVLPFFGQDMTGTYLQPLFGGNVSVSPRIRFTNFTNSLSDGTPERFRFYLLEGERAIWPALLMIENRMRIDRKLEEVTLAL